MSVLSATMTTPDGQFVLEPARIKHVPTIIDLYKQAMVPVWDRFGRDYDLDRVEENIRKHLDDPDYFIWALYPTGSDFTIEPAGYCAWEKHRDHTSNHIIAHLRMLLVQPGARRQGLASFMIKQFETRAREIGCTKVLFDVLTGSPANQFYSQHGYRQWSNFMEKRL